MRVTSTNEIVERLLAQLPEQHTPQLLYDRLTSQHKSATALFRRDPALLSDVLTLAAWSPLLATTLENNPDYVSWLQRERVSPHVRSGEELGESLARFALINSQVAPHVMISRFRRRELLRTYLHDIRHTRTVAETTEELSHLADAVLEHALKLCRQELDNEYGSPQAVDAQGRISTAEFCVVALGKLGSLELNYASDIDLIFLFSQDGLTAAGGSRGQITNREYFVRLGQRLLRMVSEEAGEGAAYRIDMRLRPNGRVGALACSLDEAVSYYQARAQDWELQTLIRSRASAGADNLYSIFAKRVLSRVFRADIGVNNALANVRLAKEKIDLQREHEESGFNVKLGRGGIREIEFIAQALQVAFGGNDAWLRAPHTLISLSRLADRKLITENEHWQLSDAYQFLRSVEHRLQMEHGLQTHTVPVDPVRRELLSRRLSFFGPDALTKFDNTLQMHTANVNAAFRRVFGEAGSIITTRTFPDFPTRKEVSVDTDSASIQFATPIFAKHSPGDLKEEDIKEILSTEAELSLNRHRALSFVTRIAASLDKETQTVTLSRAHLRSLVRVCGVSEFFGEMLASQPSLIQELVPSDLSHFGNQLKDLTVASGAPQNFGSALVSLRRAWSRKFVGIGAREAQNEITLAEVNRLLTELAIAGLEAALLIAERELAERFGQLTHTPRHAVLALGRLGSGGMDYGSDLDIIVVYDAASPSPVSRLTHHEVYARLTEYLVTAVSSITHEGYLYRVDLRLRPDGQKGALAIGSEAFIDYLQKRASIWEWLAYVKLRAVAGDLEYGRKIEFAARQTVHDLARRIDQKELLAETGRVRDRLEKEKSSMRGGLNIKHGAGGMLDVYFATRYLQLRDNVPDDGVDRTTLHLLERLRGAGSLSDDDFRVLSQGYHLLRVVDHQLRLIVGRSTTLPATDRPAMIDIARRLNVNSAAELLSELTRRMQAIRDAYERILIQG